MMEPTKWEVTVHFGNLREVFTIIIKKVDGVFELTGPRGDKLTRNGLSPTGQPIKSLSDALILAGEILPYKQE